MAIIIKYCPYAPSTSMSWTFGAAISKKGRSTCCMVLCGCIKLWWSMVDNASNCDRLLSRGSDLPKGLSCNPNISQISQYQPKKTISAKYHNISQISQYQPNIPISAKYHNESKYHNISQISQYQPNITISAKNHKSQYQPKFTI